MEPLDSLDEQFNELSNIRENDEILFMKNLPGAKKWTLFNLLLNIATLVTPIYFRLPEWRRKELIAEMGDHGKHLDESDFEAYGIRYYLPFNLGSSRTGCTVRAYAVHLLLAFLMVKEMTITYTYSSCTRELRSWNPDFAGLDESNYTRDCYIMASLKQQDQVKAAEIKRCVEWMRESGLIVPAINDLIPFASVVLCYVYFVFITFAILNRNNPNFILHPFTFLLDPLAERKRLRARYDILYCKITSSIEDKSALSSLATVKLNEHLDYHNFELYSREILHREPISCDEFASLMGWLKSEYEDVYYQKLVRTCLRNSMGSRASKNLGLAAVLVPEYVTLSSYKQQWRKVTLVCAIIIFILAFAGLLTCYAILVRVFEQWIEQTHDQVHCFLWNPRGISRKSASFLVYPRNQASLLDSDYSDDIKWTLFESSLDDYHLISLRMREIFTKRTILFMAAIVFQYVSLSFANGAYMVFLSMNHSTKSIWLTQISNQLLLIKKMMDQLDLSKGQAGETTASNVQLHKRKIEHALKLTYINFILFQKQLRLSRNYFNVIILQLGIISAGCTIIFICILSNTDDINSERTSNRFLTCLLALCFIAVFDTQFFKHITSTNKLQLLFGHVNMIMAKSTRVSMESSTIVSLWRRQILTNQETEAVYGTKILGFELSYSNFIQFNSYVLGVSLYMLRYSY